jgi:hypothetical protein
MKQIRSIIVVTFLFILAKVSAQTNEFNLSDYKLPDLNYKELVTDFGFGGSNNSFTYPADITPGKFSYNSLSGNINAAFNHYLNNSKRQKEEYARFDFSPYFNNKREDGGLVSKDYSMNPSMYYYLTNRIYHDKRFIETDLDVDYSFSRYFSNDYFLGSTVEAKTTFHDFSVILPVKIGTGRIEQVQDARQAVYIFDELAKIDRMDKEQSKEDILEFAQFISGLKKERFFDSRLRRMAELEALDSFLVAHNYLLKSDARYFSTLLDFWEFGGQSVRNSGNRLSFALYPGYSFYYYNYTADGLFNHKDNKRQNSFSVSGGIEYKHEKPISLYWQNTIDIKGYVGIMELREDSAGINKKNGSVPNMQIGYFQTISYYPNTRTYMYLTGSLQYINLFGESDSDPDVLGISGSGAKASLNYSAYYYISPKLRLRLNSSLFYIWQNSDDQIPLDFDNRSGSTFTISDYNSYMNSETEYLKNRFVGTINIGLTYSIF